MRSLKSSWYGLLAISILSTPSFAGKIERYITQPEPTERPRLIDRVSNSQELGARCGTEKAMSEFYQKFPGALKRINQERVDAQKKLKLSNAQNKGMGSEPFSAQAISANPTYVIPVVFHVYGTSFNGRTVNDAIIIDALRRTNEDFQGQTADYNDIIPEFSGVKRTLNIEFRLAKKDPNGYPTTGIVYHPNRSGFGNGSGYDAQIQADAWDNYKYMNVYIQNDLYADGGTTNSGVAWYPDTYMSNNNTARVVYNGAYLGSNTDENFRSVLTHEFGHFMDLIHTFEGGCSSANQNYCSTTGDKICDTPQVNNSSLGTAANCLGQTTNWQNFMNYSSQYANFTNQQVSRMINALNVPARNTLWSAANLIATGTDGGGSTTNQPPTAKANGPYSAAVGASISFSSAGSTDPDGSISSYSWSFGDGTSSSSANPVKAYSSAGTYTVTLTVTDNKGATGTSSTTATVSSGTSGGALTNGVAKTNIGASTGQYAKFYIDLPSGVSNLTVNSSGGSGDADMYIRQGTEPTDTTYSCRPYLSGNNESCSFSSPASGRWYINLKAYSTFSGVSLTATYTTTAPSNQPPVAKVNGPYSGAVNTNISFSSAGTSDPDGSIASYSWNFGDNTSSTSANPSHAYATAGTYTITLTVTDNQGATGTASTSVTVTGSSPPTGNTLQKGVPITVSGATGSSTIYTLEVPANATGLSFQLSGGTGDADMYVRFGSAPTTSTYDCRPYLSGNNETCNIANAQAGTYYVMLRAYSTYSGASLVGNYTTGGNPPPNGLPNACSTQAAVGSGGLVSLNSNNCVATGTQTNSTQYYYVYLPSSVSQLVFRTEHGTGNAGLHYSSSTWATTSAYQLRSINSGNVESITVNNPGAGYHYISVTGQQSGVTLSVTTQ